MRELVSEDVLISPSLYLPQSMGGTCAQKGVLDFISLVWGEQWVLKYYKASQSLASLGGRVLCSLTRVSLAREYKCERRQEICTYRGGVRPDVLSVFISPCNHRPLIVPSQGETWITETHRDDNAAPSIRLLTDIHTERFSLKEMKKESGSL